MNTLYFGDNLDVLKKHIPSESVDLIYLDPPFNSKADYSLIYKSPTGGGVDAQIQAFKDMWEWEADAAPHALDEIRQRDVELFRIMQALQVSLGEGDMMAYLVMMAVRLLELRRVMKPTASLYLHCDPTASHYLKIILDAIFGPSSFRNEIIWRRTGSHNSAKRFGPIHDTILFYTKGKKYTWNPIRRPYMLGHVDKAFIKDGDRYVTNYSGNILTGSGTRNGESGKPWRGFDPTAKNRHWAIPSVLLEGFEAEVDGMSQHEKMDFLLGKGFITIKPDDEWPRYVREVGDQDGQLVGDIWAYQPYTEGTVFGTGVGIDDDVRWMGSKDSDRLGYQTQKPVGLMKRIVAASSKPGDVVLDPFCGCGTTIHAAELLGRQWIGIDVAVAAIQVIQDRLTEWLPHAKYKVDGIPTAVPEARALAAIDPHTFQQWAVGRLGGQPRGKGFDRGIDGEIIFLRGVRDYGRAIVSVKAGQNVNPAMVRELGGTVRREEADLGVFVCLRASKEMKLEASRSELVTLPGGVRHRIQIVEVGDLIEGPNLGILTQLNVLQAAQAAKGRKKPKRPTPEKLRTQRPLPPMPIKGGKPGRQAELPMAEPLLSQQPETKRRKRS